MTCRIDFFPTHIHLKTAKPYMKICEATLEANMLPVTVYANEKGRVWVRPSVEFDQNLRFEPINYDFPLPEKVIGYRSDELPSEENPRKYLDVP